jgi:hypothetical protein
MAHFALIAHGATVSIFLHLYRHTTKSGLYYQLYLGILPLIYKYIFKKLIGNGTNVFNYICRYTYYSLLVLVVLLALQLSFSKHIFTKVIAIHQLMRVQ